MPCSVTGAQSSPTHPLHTQASPSLCLLPQIYWFKDGKQVSQNDHYSIRMTPAGTCPLHPASRWRTTAITQSWPQTLRWEAWVATCSHSAPARSPSGEAACLMGRWSPMSSVQLGFPAEISFPECLFTPLDVCVWYRCVHHLFHNVERLLCTPLGAGAAILREDEVPKQKMASK